jgi:anaerobic selenocysteine-containing dehydrogenase
MIHVAHTGVARATSHDSGSRVVRGACPLDCPDTCSWIITVKHGQSVTLRRDPEHAYTRGALCNKVANYLQ